MTGPCLQLAHVIYYLNIAENREIDIPIFTDSTTSGMLYISVVEIKNYMAKSYPTGKFNNSFKTSSFNVGTNISSYSVPAGTSLQRFMGYKGVDPSQKKSPYSNYISHSTKIADSRGISIKEESTDSTYSKYLKTKKPTHEEKEDYSIAYYKGDVLLK